MTLKVRGRREVGALAEFNRKTAQEQRPAADFWHKTLYQIPTVFGRLVHVASLRDEATGRYRGEDLLQLLGPADADRALRQIHYQIFSQWLAFGLAEQKMDLDAYLEVVGAPKHTAHYRTLVPGSAHAVERLLFLTDLETLLELLRVERGGAFPTGEA